MPTPEQLKAYADQLPAIYRDVLTAFVNADPGRRHGDSVAVPAVLDQLRRMGKSTSDPDECVRALYNLEDAEFLAWSDIFLNSDRLADPNARYTSSSSTTTTTTAPPGPNPVPGGRYTPTELGEELIAVVTGVRAKRLAVPALPSPTW